MNSKQFVNTLIFLTVFTLASPPALAALSPDKAYEQGIAMYKTGDYPAAIEYLNQAITQNPTAANYKALGQVFEAARQYNLAAQAYNNTAAIYQQKGLLDDAEIYRRKAEAWTTTIELYQQLDKTTVFASTLGKYEPANGIYIGAYIDDDPRLQTKTGYVKTDFQRFNQLAGKEHPVFFTYVEYGERFPSEWVEAVLRAGAVPQLAWEPNQGLGSVQDDAYLRQFARDAAAIQRPVFLRFASEMNGSWTAYYGNPSDYISKFRLVSQVMAAEAPNVAMVWTVNSVPQKNIADYYPGDAYLDWVGLNMYSVAYHNGDPGQPALNEDPTSLLDYVYQLYSTRKPIQISEYGATHRSNVVPQQDLSFLAIRNIGQLYNSLPRRYPRVKMINWFDNDNLTAHNVPPERRNDNYSLTANPAVLQAYQQAIAGASFLARVAEPGQEASSSPVAYQLIANQISPAAGVTISAWIRAYDADYQLSYYLDGQPLPAADQRPHSLQLEPGVLTPGIHQLEVRVTDSTGAVAATANFQVIAGNGTAAATSGRLPSKLVLQLNNRQATRNGAVITLGAPPVALNGYTLVPLRFLAESLGASVNWDTPSQTAVFTLNGSHVQVTINQSTALINGQPRLLDTPAQLRNGWTMVPLRFIAEALGASVDWNGTNQEITITQ